MENVFLNIFVEFMQSVCSRVSQRCGLILGSASGD